MTEPCDGDTVCTNDHHLKLTRRFRASPQFLFDCFTDPTLVAQWWGPEGTHCPRAVSDLRVGGAWEFDMIGDDSGLPFHVKGRYLEIQRPYRLVFSWVWDNSPQEETRVTLTFRAVNASETDLTLLHDRFPNANRAGEHHTGWVSSLDALAQAVAQHNSTADRTGNQESNAK